MSTVTFSMSTDHVVETLDTSVTFGFELDEAPAAGGYVSVWLYATTDENGAIQDAMDGHDAFGDMDLYSLFSPDSQDGIDIFSYNYDVSVEAGVSPVSDFSVIEIRLTQQYNMITLPSLDDGSDADNPRSFYWNVIDDPTHVSDVTVIDGSQAFTEYRDAEDVPSDNTAPVAENEQVSTVFDTPLAIDVLANDHDVDGDPLTIDKITVAPDFGTVEIVGDEIIYTPNAGFSGLDVFRYRITDGHGETDTARVRVTVESAPNSDPVGVNDTATTAFETAIAIDVLANDTDADGDMLTIEKLTREADNGTVDIIDNELVYTPDAGFSGVDVFRYKFSDGNGGMDSAKVRVTVDAPLPPEPEAFMAEPDYLL